MPFCIANSYYLRYNEKKGYVCSGGEVFEENKKDNFLGLGMYIFDYYEWTGRVLFNVIPGYSCNIIIFLLYTSALLFGSVR